jgi:hypothetical protein
MLPLAFLQMGEILTGQALVELIYLGLRNHWKLRWVHDFVAIAVHGIVVDVMVKSTEAVEFQSALGLVEYYEVIVRGR